MVTISTRESTKENLAENVSIITVTQKEYCLQQSRTYRQAKRIMENLGLTPGSSEKSVNDHCLTRFSLLTVESVLAHAHDLSGTSAIIVLPWQ